MTKKRKTITLNCRYGDWKLSRRGGDDGVIQADGRSNSINFGRHSLGVRDMAEAKQIVHDLDIRMAVKYGLADPRSLEQQAFVGLTIERGLSLYRKFMGRPLVSQGIAQSTNKRYERIIKSVERFVETHGIKCWEQVNEDLLHDYANERAERYTISSVATELTLLLRIHRYLIRKKYLDSKFYFDYPITRAKESTRYCPTTEEMRAIIEILATKPEQRWLYECAAILSHTGLRFGELAALTWNDVERVNTSQQSGMGFLHVRDESHKGENARSTKTGYSRRVPIHSHFAKIIEGLARNPNDNLLLHGPRGGKLRCDSFADHLRDHALVPLSKRFPHPRFQTITAHSLRHFFNSMCAASNVSQQTAMDWMGHRTDSMAKRYFHRDDKASLRNIEKIEPLLDVPSDRSDDTLSNPVEPEADDSKTNDTDDN